MSDGWGTPGRRGFAQTDLSPDDYALLRDRSKSSEHGKLLARPPFEVDMSSWDGDLSRRRIRVRTDQLVFELFGTPSDSKRLLVFLSAGGGALKDGRTPQFPRASWHPLLDGIGLNIDDPTFAAFPNKLQTGWYLGTPEHDAVPSVARLIQRVQEKHGVAPSDTYIIGSSAGGTSALKVAGAVPGATAIAENPPIFPNESSSSRYLKRVGIDLDSYAYRQRNDLGHVFDHPTSRFVILQNAADTQFRAQLFRFLATVGLPEPRIGLNERGPLSVYMTSAPTLSPHHVFLSVHEFGPLLSVLSQHVGGEARGAVLDAVHEGLRTRALADDQLSNHRGWSNLFARMEIPELADLPMPTPADVVRLPLRKNDDVTYRIRMGHRARSVFIALDVKPELSRTSDAELVTIASKIGAKLTRTPPQFRLSMSEVPLRDVPKRLQQFVTATTKLF